MSTPRWKRLLQEAIDDGLRAGRPDTLHYCLATACVDEAGRVQPHSRTVGHRGFLNCSPDDPSARKQSEYLVDAQFEESTTLVFTTDVRSQKALDVHKQLEQGQEPRAAAVWYFPSKKLQVRIEGSLHLLAHPSHASRKKFEADTSRKRRLAPTPRGLDATTTRSENFDWERVRRSYLSSLNSWLRAGLLRPAPGIEHPNQSQLTALDSWPGEAESEEDNVKISHLERPWTQSFYPEEIENPKERDALLERIDQNFAVMLFRPDLVDIVDLTTDRRSLATRTPEEDCDHVEQWSEMRIVP